MSRDRLQMLSGAAVMIYDQTRVLEGGKVGRKWVENPAAELKTLLAVPKGRGGEIANVADKQHNSFMKCIYFL